MGAKYLPRFTDPAAVHQFSPDSLLELLFPFSDFFANHGIVLPSNPDALPCEAVALALFQPMADTPFELVDALVHIHEMATPEAMEGLIDAAGQRGIALPANPPLTPADVALRVWLADPEVLRRRHAEQVVLRRRSFESFLPRDGAKPLRATGVERAIELFEADATAWFNDQERGEGVRVHPIVDDHEVRLVVRHGGPYRREGCITSGRPSTVHFRPMDFHFLVLDLAEEELKVNCRSRREVRLYRESIGRRFFGQPDFFDERSTRYTLEPLRLGRQSLVCSDIPGMRAARLIELAMYRGGPYGRRTIEQATDVFLALEADGERIPRSALLTKAKIEVEFDDSRKPRPFSIGSFNRASYTRDGDAALVEELLRRRGLMLGGRRAAVA